MASLVSSTKKHPVATPGGGVSTAQHNGSPPVGAPGVSSVQTIQLPSDRNLEPASIAQTWAERKGLANFLEQKWLRPSLLHLEASGVLDSSTPGEIVLDLPYNQLCVFARSYESSKPLQGLPVYAIAVLKNLGPAPAPSATIIPRPESFPRLSLTGDSNPSSTLLTAPAAAGEPNPAAPHTPKYVGVPLGVLGTDHVGYASFDLSVLRSLDVLEALVREGVVAPRERARVGLAHLWLLPFADLLLVSDALQYGDVGPSHIAIRLELDEQRLAGRELSFPAPSMQNPNLLDWRMSPGSFTLQGSLLIGSDGCETFLPTTLATQQFRFYQVARVAKKVLSTNGHVDFRLGHVFSYTTEWFSIGHSLGSLVYSLPLAPGEVVKLAVIDWSRSEQAERSEDTGFSENLQHSAVRDRSLSEHVKALLDEWQRGGNVQAGVAASASSGALGGAAALGGGYSTSSGTRELTADTAQRISDAFSQATSAVRELRSTVVVQGSQAEAARAQTRVVANYNHGHALTIMYYEVLRHYRVLTRLVASQLAVLVNYESQRSKFDDASLWANRTVLENALLDPRLAKGFDSLESIRTGRRWAQVQGKESPGPGDTFFTAFVVTFKTADKRDAGTDADVFVTLYGPDKTEYNLIGDGVLLSGWGRRLGRKEDFERGSTTSVNTVVENRDGVRWRDVVSFVVGLRESNSFWAGWNLEGVTLEGVQEDGSKVIIFSGGYDKDKDIKEGDASTFPVFDLKPTLDAFVSTVELQNVDSLREHILAHAHHYNRALWLAEDPEARAVRFETLTLGSHSLLDVIENRAMEVSGNFVAFPIVSGETARKSILRLFDYRDVDPATPRDAFVEQLLYTPARGVAAEAKLGRCNANEKIDETRFWDWQKSPIPVLPSDIAPISTESRAKDPVGLAPTAFPQSVVNIQAPQALPDPVGLAAALKVLGTPNIFGDYSLGKETAALLQKLSDNATVMAKAGLESSQQKNTLQEIRNAPELTPETKAKLVEQYLAKEAGIQQTTGNGTGTGTGSGTPTGGTTGGTTTGGATTGGTTGGTTTGGTGGTTTGGTTTGGATTGGTTTGGTTTGGTTTGGPASGEPTGGNTTSNENKPKPQGKPPSKPKQPVPTMGTPGTSPQGKGLLFQINFQSAYGAPITNGSAYARILSTANQVAMNNPGPVDSYPPGWGGISSIPGEETFVDNDITNGMAFQTHYQNAPGTVTLEIEYEIMVASRADVISSMYANADGSAAPVPFHPVTLRMTGQCSYIQPSGGNTVVLSVTPTLDPAIDLSWGDANEREAQMGAIAGTSDKFFIKAEVNGHIRNSATDNSQVTLHATTLNGGLTVQQKN